MALNDNAAIVINTGRYYTAPVGTAYPEDPKNPGQDWTDVGHTSQEDIITISSEGGDRTTLGSLQNKQLKVSTTPRTESFGINVHQFDVETLKLYYGSNAVSIEGGKLLGIPSNPAPTERAFLAVLTDGVVDLSIYAPKASIFRGDDLDITDTESLASLPLSITPLGHLTNPFAYAITPVGGTGDIED